jgi:chromosome segregation ATPase
LKTERREREIITEISAREKSSHDNAAQVLLARRERDFMAERLQQLEDARNGEVQSARRGAEERASGVIKLAQERLETAESARHDATRRIADIEDRKERELVELKRRYAEANKRMTTAVDKAERLASKLDQSERDRLELRSRFLSMEEKIKLLQSNDDNMAIQAVERERHKRESLQRQLDDEHRARKLDHQKAKKRISSSDERIQTLEQELKQAHERITTIMVESKSHLTNELDQERQRLREHERQLERELMEKTSIITKLEAELKVVEMNARTDMERTIAQIRMEAEDGKRALHAQYAALVDRKMAEVRADLGSSLEREKNGLGEQNRHALEQHRLALEAKVANEVQQRIKDAEDKAARLVRDTEQQYKTQNEELKRRYETDLQNTLAALKDGIRNLEDKYAYYCYDPSAHPTSQFSLN